MSRSRAVVSAPLLAVMLFGAVSAAPASTRATDEPEPAQAGVPGTALTDRVVVRWRDAGQALGLERSRNLQRIRDLGLPGAAVVSTRGRGLAQTLEALRADPSVLYAEPDYTVMLADDPAVWSPEPTDAPVETPSPTAEPPPASPQPSGSPAPSAAPSAAPPAVPEPTPTPDLPAATPSPHDMPGTPDEGGLAAVGLNDPLSGDQYSLDSMRVRDAWSISRGSSGIVAVLDTGVQANHPDLSGRVLAGHDFVNGDGNAADDNGHGTWVAGIIAAKGNNAAGIAGISWNARILPVKVMAANGTGYTSWLTSGIVWAADKGASVINMSVGGFPYSRYVEDAVNYAWSKGAVLVGAAGNNRLEEEFYPASYGRVVSVSATQDDDEFTNWSSYGPKVDVSAPGASIVTTNCDANVVPGCAYVGKYITISGTSFATPNVAGVVSLIRGRYPGWTPQQVVSRLLTSTDDLGYADWDKRYGHGRVNAHRALGGASPAVLAPGRGAFEPNDGWSQVRSLTLGTIHRPANHPAGDVDFFSVDLPRAGMLRVTVTPIIDTVRVLKSSLPFDPIVEVFGADRVRLIRKDSPDSNATEMVTRTSSGATRFYVRVTNWFPNGNPATYTIRAEYIDNVAPATTQVGPPSSGSTMVSAYAPVHVTFSEPVTGIGATSMQLRSSTGAVLPATVTYDSARRLAVARPTAPLPTGAVVTATLSSEVRDLAGNVLAARSWSFAIAPGQAFAPPRPVTFAAGVQAGYRMGPGGVITASRVVSMASTTTARAGQRAAMSNLPGSWLMMVEGPLAGMWVQESPRAAPAGLTGSRALATGTRLNFASGAHGAYRFDAAGTRVAQRTITLNRASGANVDMVAVINGRRHYRVVNGLFAGWWVLESPRAYRGGIVDRQEINPTRRVAFAAGWYTGTAFADDGTPLSTKRARLGAASGAPTTAWAVIGGREYLHISAGVWAGMWMPAESIRNWER